MSKVVDSYTFVAFSMLFGPLFQTFLRIIEKTVVYKLKQPPRTATIKENGQGKITTKDVERAVRSFSLYFKIHQAATDMSSAAFVQSAELER
ncbi:hypothetical protein [Exiguobacterium sp. KRL4]|uniref:hypothetical protein n=1 Tax=Exiguobacterium sp. KRL4 TaxID=1914536 RepID=UPI0013731277|nr:hypothetical protein [Exiguobacterium sp. KRL4]